MKVFLFLLLGFGCVSQAQTVNYSRLQTFRLVEVRQTGPNGPKITGYNVGFYADFNTTSAVSILQVRTPQGRTLAYQKDGPKRWKCWTRSIASSSAYLKAYPAGAYLLSCLGGSLGGQNVVFRIPAEDLVNPSLPYLQANSYRLITSRKMRADLANTLVVQRVLARGRPFVTTPSPPIFIDSCTAQIRDLSQQGTDGEFVWYQAFSFDASQAASITIPAGTLRRNKVYNLSLQTDHTASEENVITPEGSIPHARGGITFYELVFKTAR